MLKKSERFGTKLTVGPRLKKFHNAGYAEELLWSENYPDQEEATADGRGRFQRTREFVETARLEELFDLWCRGQNLVGYAGKILRVVALFNKIFKKSAQ